MSIKTPNTLEASYTKGELTMKFEELTCVRTLKDFPKHKIKKGDIGVIVFAFTKPNEAYEVEFDDDTGRLKAIFPILSEDLERYE